MTILSLPLCRHRHYDVLGIQDSKYLRWVSGRWCAESHFFSVWTILYKDIVQSYFLFNIRSECIVWQWPRGLSKSRSFRYSDCRGLRVRVENVTRDVIRRMVLTCLYTLSKLHVGLSAVIGGCIAEMYRQLSVFSWQGRFRHSKLGRLLICGVQILPKILF